MVLITEMLEICIQTSYDQNVKLILKSYLPVVYGTPLNGSTKTQNPLFSHKISACFSNHCTLDLFFETLKIDFYLKLQTALFFSQIVEF
jgi:hypothetical protein